MILALVIKWINDALILVIAIVVCAKIKLRNAGVSFPTYCCLNLYINTSKVSFQSSLQQPHYSHSAKMLLHHSYLILLYKTPSDRGMSR